MKPIIVILTISTLAVLVFWSFTRSDNSAVSKDRVKAAYQEKEALLKKKLQEKNLTFENLNVLLVAYKAEKILEVYVKNKTAKKYQKLTEYAVCASSGELGPKRKSGDYQVPEGFYYIDRFNPASSYHLSLGVNYPNQSDKIKSTAKDLGGDIFIHGACVTIGCLPMTDDKIKEIYIYALEAKKNGKIPVYIFPFRMNEQNMKKYKKQYAENTSLLEFWSNLQEGYELFLNNQTALSISVDKKGNYLF